MSRRWARSTCRGTDAARFLDFLYANTFSTLPVGRARYGIMLREDGMVFDDGTTSRLAPEHFLVTTTTANAAAVLEHLEFQLQANCRELEVLLTDVCDQWAQFAVAGPRAREVLSRCAPGARSVQRGLSLHGRRRGAPSPASPGACSASPSPASSPTSWRCPPARRCAPGRRCSRPVSRTASAPYGLDALNTLRIEKGHVTGAELNGNTSAATWDLRAC